MISASVIREARLRAGLSQAQLAARLATSQQAISRWESGRALPPFETLRRILRACELELAFSVVPLDRSYDSLIEQQLSRSPEARVRHLRDRLAFKQRMRQAQEAASAIRSG